MTIFLVVARVTLRALAGRRRTILMLLLAAVPVVVGAIVKANGGLDSPSEIATTLDALVVRMILPLVALVFGTAALGSELEDGSVVHLLTKPISRTTIVLAKVAVAGTLTAALVVPSAVATALLLGRFPSDGVDAARALGVGVFAGSFVYAAIFAALSVVTSRGLIIGLGYALVWEGLLAGLLPGTQAFSVREYIRGLAHTIIPGVIESTVGSAAVLYIVITLVGALALASWRLATYQVRGSE